MYKRKREKKSSQEKIKYSLNRTSKALPKWLDTDLSSRTSWALWPVGMQNKLRGFAVVLKQCLTV